MQIQNTNLLLQCVTIGSKQNFNYYFYNCPSSPDTFSPIEIVTHQVLMGLKLLYMFINSEERHPNTMYDFPIVWEDVLRVQKELETQIELLQEEQDKLLDDFCDLIQIIIDAELPESLKDKVRNKFINSKTEQNGRKD